MNASELIDAASAVVRSRKAGDYTVGDVGCALETDKGNLYLGVCIDVRSSMGFCAEHNAIGAMITAGETRIARIAAVWKGEGGAEHVLSPCGRCREFIYQTDKRNIDTEVVLGDAKIVPLRELLPYADWFEKRSGPGA